MSSTKCDWWSVHVNLGAIVFGLHIVLCVIIMCGITTAFYWVFMCANIGIAEFKKPWHADVVVVDIHAYILRLWCACSEACASCAIYK